MTRGPDRPAHVFHLTSLADWAEARRVGALLPASLASEGFVHCSTASQVRATAGRYLRGRTDLLLLTIRVARLSVELRYERSASTGEDFPHVYGPIPVAAVVAVEPLVPDAGGLFPGPPPEEPGPLSGARARYLFLDAIRLDALADWYVTVLGFSVVAREPGAFAFLRPHPGVAFELALYPAGGDAPPSPRSGFLVLDVDDLEACLDALRAHDAKVGEPYAVPLGRAVMVEDPEGNRIQLHQPEG